MDTGALIDSLVADEIAAIDARSRADSMTLRDFSARRVKRPRPVTVNFSGGIEQECWTVTRSDGCYSVLFMPSAGYFTLCVDSDFGPLDIGVHGRAIQCFSAVQ